MHRILIASVLLQTVVVTGCLAQSVDAELRPVTVEDVQDGPDWEVRQTDPEYFLAVQDDFDGDGLKDEARLMANDADQVLLIRLTWGDASMAPALFDLMPLSNVTRVLLTTVPAGDLVHICKPERDTCHDLDRATTVINNPGVARVHFGGTQVVYAWNGETMVDYSITD